MKSIDHTKVARNLVFSGISEGTNGLTFILMILAARFLGDSDFGIYCFALAFVSLFQLFSDWGLTYASTIEIARDRSKGKYFLGGILGFQTISCVVIGLVIIVTAQFLRISPLARNVIYLQTFIMIIRSYKLTFRWIFKAYERFDLETITLVFERGAILCIGAYVLVKGFGLYAFVLTFLFVRILDIVFTATLSRIKVISAMPRFSVQNWWAMAKKGLPFVVSYTLIFIFFQIDTVMLGIMKTSREVGWYNAPFRIIEGLLVIPAIISYALLPTLSQAHTISMETVTGIYRRGSKYLIIMSLPVISTCVIAAPKLIPFIFGGEYTPSILLFQLLMPSMLFLFLSNLGSTVLSSIDRQKIVIKKAAICVVLNITLNYLLIPHYGARGAAIATIITEAVFFLIINRYLIRNHYGFSWKEVLLKPVIAGCFLLILQLVFHSISLSLFLIFSVIIYLSSLFLLKIFDEKEIKVIRNLLKSFFGFFLKKKG